MVGNFQTLEEKTKEKHEHRNHAGRMKSIFMASWLAQQHKKTDVFVHDCNRIVEATYSDKYLRPANLQKSFDRLRHYYIK